MNMPLGLDVNEAYIHFLMQGVSKRLANDISVYHITYDYAQSSLSYLESISQPLPQALSRAVLKRKCDYLAGRVCASNCLKRLRSFRKQVAYADNGAPVWPVNFIGSISHAEGVAIAIAANSHEYSALGIDLEFIANAEDAHQYSDLIFNADEIALLQHYFHDKALAFTVGFSAKETLYKSFNPILKTYIDFKDVAIVKVNPFNGSLSCRLNARLFKHWMGNVIPINYLATDEIVITWYAREREVCYE